MQVVSENIIHQNCNESEKEMHERVNELFIE